MLPLTTLLYVVVLQVSYVLFVEPTFAYLGMGYRQPILWAYAALVALICGTSALMPRRIQCPSDTVLWVHFVVATVPTVVVPQFTPLIDTTLAMQFGLVVVVCWGLVLLAVRFLARRSWPARQLPRRLARPMTRVTTHWWVGGLITLSVCADVLLFLLPGVEFNAVGFADVTGVRLAYRDGLAAVPGFVPYVLLAATNVVNPTLLGYGMLRIRRLPLVLLGAAGQLLNYAVTGYKTVALSLVVVIVIALWLQRRAISGWGFLSATIAGALAALTLFMTLGQMFAATFFTTRMLIVPGNVASAVVAYFEDRPPLYWSYSFMSWLLDYPYDRDPSFLVGVTLGGNEATSANTNLFGDGYMNLGYPGIALECGALVVILVVLDRAAAGVPATLGVAALVVPAFALSNSSPFTSVLTHGMFFAMVVLGLAPRDPSLYDSPRRRKSSSGVTEERRVELSSKGEHDPHVR